jgi:hypothetical protein
LLSDSGQGGLGRLPPFATTRPCILAANSPDADVAVGFFADRWTLLNIIAALPSIVGTTLAIILPVLLFDRARPSLTFSNANQDTLRGLDCH